MRAYAYEFRKKIKENAEKLIKEIEEEEESNATREPRDLAGLAAQHGTCQPAVVRAYQNQMDCSDQYNSE
jgi:hypothetical protein